MICILLPARLMKRVGHRLGLGGLQLRRLAHDAEHGDAVAADLGVEIGQPVDRVVVDAAVVEERRRRDGEGAGGFGGQFHHGPLWMDAPF